MTSYDIQFGESKDNHTSDVQYWNQELDPNSTVQDTQELKNKITHNNTSAFTELFEDLHRYIQQEQNSSFSTNDTEYSQNVTITQNGYYQHNSFIPVQNMVQFQSTIPVQAAYPHLSHQKGVVHRAHISFVPTNGTLRTITKRKRKRTIFTTEQVEELEKYFAKKSYVTREDRQILVQRLNINDKAVKIWFQNRRLKGKRDHEALSNNETEINTPELHLDYIESQIKEKTDKFGFVTLDEAMMCNLVNIIDYCLVNNDAILEERMKNSGNNDQTFEEPINTCDSSPIYEPISPPDSTKEEDNTIWESYESSEYLQTLLDLQSISS